MVVSEANVVRPPDEGDDWLGLTTEALPVGVAYDWAVVPRCGAVVVFSGVVRDHGTDLQGTVRADVRKLTYEAYDEQVVPRLAAIAAEIRNRWPSTGRVVLLHRVGELDLGESSVVVVVSSPHRSEAFEAARFGIDTLKESVPIWKLEHWQGGQDWALGSRSVTGVSAIDASVTDLPAVGSTVRG